MMYGNFNAVTYLENLILKKMKERKRIMDFATEQKKRNVRGHTVKGLESEIRGLCEGLAAVYMQREADKNDGNCKPIYESDIRADLTARLNSKGH